MEEEDDLELLRLAALKSLKKENVPAVKDTNNAIPVVSNVRANKYYKPIDDELIQPNLIHHPVPPFGNVVFGGMDMTEYVPQRLDQSNVAPYNEFAAFPQMAINPPTNVQLSPRSAAFVYENKQIIKRRQGISPAGSPVPFRKSPGRWSVSPTAENWKYRRSQSRSPPYANHAAPFRNRSGSRSPHHRRHSPQPTANTRRNRSRSPASRTNFDTNTAHRSERRSPVPNRRMNSPSHRQPPRVRRGHSPQRDNGSFSRKSGSPRADDATHRRRRTRSPNTQAKTEVRRNSLSRSPGRKYPRNSSKPRRTTPTKRFNNMNIGNKSNHNGVRSRNHNHSRPSPAPNRRSNSPHNHHKRRSPVKSNGRNDNAPQKHHENDVECSNSQRSKDPSEKTANEEKIENESNEDKQKCLTEREIEDKLLASSDSECSDSDNNDGIDLFASEESESENEGRFKSSSSKTERKTTVTTVSFSELGKAAVAPTDAILRDLDELQTGTSHTQRKGAPRGENDRNGRSNTHRDDRRYNRDREVRDRDRERERDKNRDRTREKERGSSRSKSGKVEWKSSKNMDENRKKDEPTGDSGTSKNEKKPTLFKSTFTSIENETRSKTSSDSGKCHGHISQIPLTNIGFIFITAGKVVETKSKLGEKRSAVQLKRSSKPNEKSEFIKWHLWPKPRSLLSMYLVLGTDTKGLQSAVTGSTMSEKRSSPTSDGGSAAGKKPIHLRLGGMTKHWKTSKKTWKTEKVLSIVV